MAKLRASFTLRIQLTDRKVAYIYTTSEEFRAAGADLFTVSRGMVNLMSDLKGIDIWANFTETENGVVCEMRSSGEDINQVAVRHGGGGHVNASGAMLKDKAEAMAVLRELDALMEAKNGGRNTGTDSDGN